MSQVTVVGNLQGNPELSFTSAGKALCRFTVRETSGKGENRKQHYYDVTCFGDIAQNVAESLPDRTRIIVVGSLEQQRWETAEGAKRSKVGIVAWNVGPDLTYNTVTVSEAEGATAPAAAGAALDEAPF